MWEKLLRVTKGAWLADFRAGHGTEAIASGHKDSDGPVSTLGLTGGSATQRFVGASQHAFGYFTCRSPETGMPLAFPHSAGPAPEKRYSIPARETPMSSAKSNNWPLLLLFAGSLLTPVFYIGAAAVGWIDWAVWSPIALSAALLALSSASWINRTAK